MRPSYTCVQPLACSPLTDPKLSTPLHLRASPRVHCYSISSFHNNHKGPEARTKKQTPVLTFRLLSCLEAEEENEIIYPTGIPAFPTRSSPDGAREKGDITWQ